MISVLIFLLLVRFSWEENWCSLCANHVGCRNNGRMASNCPKDAQIIKLDEFSKRIFVAEHNKLRNTIASGMQRGFPPACHMMAVVRSILNHFLFS